MNRPFPLLLVGAALCGGLNYVALAQSAAAPAPKLPTPLIPAAGAEVKSVHPLRIQNVRPGLMAFWLDPKNNPLSSPAQPSGTSPYKTVPMGRAKNMDSNSAFHLPPGIERIVADDAQKVLLVYGTDEAVRELTDTIAFLDRPLRQVEIEAQWVIISREDVRAFGIDYPVSQGNFNDAATGHPADPLAPGTISVGFVRGNYAATLAQLVKEKRAEVLMAPRILAINNLKAAINSSTSSPAKVSFQDDPNHLAARFEGATQIGVEYSLTVTPTINNDDTVTVLMSTSSKLKLTTAAGDELISPDVREALETIVNVRDGDTVALIGLSSRPAAARRGAKILPDSHLMIFLTARIVRRADEAVKDEAIKAAPLPHESLGGRTP